MKFIDTFKLLSFTKVNIFLIAFLPLSLLIGSLINNLIIILITIIFLLDCKFRNNFYIFKEKNFIFLLIIWLYLVFNSFYVGETTDSIIRAIGYIRFFILAYAIFFYLNIEKKLYEKKILKYWVFLFLVVSIDLIIESIFGRNMLGYAAIYPGRLASFTGDELKIGGYYFGFISLTSAFFYNYNKRFFIFYFITFFILSLLIGERANFIKIFLIYLMFVFTIMEVSNLKKSIILISLFVMTVLIISNANGFKSKFYNQVFNKVNKADKISLQTFKPEELVKNLHLSHYYTAINIFKENPIIGIGLKEFRIESKKTKYSPIKNAYGLGMHPHQVHFEILAELGIVGYLLIISNVIYVMFNLFKTDKKNNILIKSSIIFVIVTFVPLIPSGSFFTTYGATIYWINYSLLITGLVKKKNFNKIFSNNGKIKKL